MSAPISYGETAFTRPLQNGPPRFSFPVDGNLSAVIMEEDYQVLTRCFQQFKYTLGSRHPRRLDFYLVNVIYGRGTVPQMMSFTLQWATIPSSHFELEAFNVSNDLLSGMGSDYSGTKVELDLITLDGKPITVDASLISSSTDIISRLPSHVGEVKVTDTQMDNGYGHFIDAVRIEYKQKWSRNGYPGASGTTVLVPWNTPETMTVSSGVASNSNRQTSTVVATVVHDYDLGPMSPLLPDPTGSTALVSYTTFNGPIPSNTVVGRVLAPSTVQRWKGPIFRRSTKFGPNGSTITYRM